MRRYNTLLMSCFKLFSSNEYTLNLHRYFEITRCQSRNQSALLFLKNPLCIAEFIEKLALLKSIHNKVKVTDPYKEFDYWQLVLIFCLPCVNECKLWKGIVLNQNYCNEKIYFTLKMLGTSTSLCTLFKRMTMN